MPSTIINTKIVLVRWTGTTLTLPSGSGAITAAPWVVNVDKIVLIGPRNATTGINAKTVYTGKYGGKTPGGVLGQLVNGETYEVYTGGNPVVSWELPTSIKIKEIVEGAGTTPAPTITSFSPTTGSIGSTFTITGTNLSNALAVAINGAVGQITNNTATSLTATVSAIATTGTVKVYTPGGPATSSAVFTVQGVQLDPPSGFSANENGAGTIAAAWDSVLNNNGYELQASTSTSFPETAATKTVQVLPDFGGGSITGLTGGLTYYVRVRAKGQLPNYTNSEWSVIRTVNLAGVPQLVAPTGFTAEPQSSSSIGTSWNNTSTGNTGYEVEYALSANFSPSTKVSTAANATQLSITGLTASTLYFLRIRALGASPSDYTAPAQVTTGNNLVAPNDLTVSAARLASWTPIQGVNYEYEFIEAPAQEPALPTDLTVNEATGEVSWTPQPGTTLEINDSPEA
ncbi:fibronectin type III domain-containing protein [Hymenobacter metallicola]|uniref:Fibronectin type-III domain-containing protein n=1 Tax=Hymenobacter metallicola TaxID=2563114 RepID=A0A4Z0QM25_9BACT|nr:fibronectin type III domain-containing protein [Hymenobacter metallicola]TGE29792.1 hypothetical protein E5K02_10135 [Hymenobacter metallicola]